MINATQTEEVKYTYYGTDLVEERERLGLTQIQVQILSGISQQQISKLEQPYLITIRKHTADALSRAGIVFNTEAKGE
jgi:transcriptional regulator with XRE-family HTH domain